MSPSPSSLHQVISSVLVAALGRQAPETFAVTGAVEIRFNRQLTGIPDLLVVRSIEDRTTKPGIYAQFGIPHYWRIEPEPLRVTTYQLGHGEGYRMGATSDRLTVDEPFPLDLPLAELLPRWAR